MSSQPRVTYRQVRPITLPASLAELTGPLAGVYELPRNLVWSGQKAFDFGQERDLRAAYKIVLIEAMRPADLHRWLNETALRRLWPQLRLPAAVRERWEQAFPELAT